MGENCVLFARERVSFEHLKKHASKCKVYIDHDMALHIDVDEIRNRRYPPIPIRIMRKLTNKMIGNPSNDLIPSIRKLIGIFLFELISSMKTKEYGNFFRNDAEASGLPIPKDNSDLSFIYELSTQSRAIVEYTVWLLFRYLAGFRHCQNGSPPYLYRVCASW